MRAAWTTKNTPPLYGGISEKKPCWGQKTTVWTTKHTHCCLLIVPYPQGTKSNKGLSFTHMDCIRGKQFQQISDLSILLPKPLPLIIPPPQLQKRNENICWRQTSLTPSFSKSQNHCAFKSAVARINEEAILFPRLVARI